MLFLIDEDVPRSVGIFLRDRGHTVHFVQDALSTGAADALVANWAHLNEGIVVTFNARHFDRLISRKPDGGRTRYRHAGRLTLKCHQTRALQRIEALIEIIEFEYEQCQRRSDKRLMVEITDSRFSTNR